MLAPTRAGRAALATLMAQGAARPAATSGGSARIDLGLAVDALRRMAAAFMLALPRLVAAIGILLVSVLVARLVRGTVHRAVGHHHSQRNLQVAVGRLAYAAAVAVCALLAATVAFPSFTIGSLIQLLGVGGVVIGFAFKDVLQNFLAGILLLVTRPFAIGDQIIVDSYEGTVEEIQTRATLIQTYDRRRVVVPNVDLFTKAVTVNTAFAVRRMMYDLTVAADTDLGAVRAALVAVAHDIAGVERDPVADVLMVKLAGGAMTLRLLWWSASQRADYMVIQDRVLTAVRDRLHAMNVRLIG